MMTLTARVFRTVGPHFVSLSCVQWTPDKQQERAFVFSGFVVEIHGAWLYVTAGHILRGVREALDKGYTFDHWRLDDQTAGKSLKSFNGMAIPYAFNIEEWLVIEDEGVGLDYAAVCLSDMYRRGLEAGGAVAIASDIWGDHVVRHDRWVLVGIPKESIDYDGRTNIEARIVLAPLTRAPTPPQAGAKSQNQFYAPLQDDPDGLVKDIDGMSGGPIFGLAYVNDQWLYQVIGVQSGWYASTRTISACPFSSFARAIEAEVARGRDAEASSDGQQPSAA